MIYYLPVAMLAVSGLLCILLRSGVLRLLVGIQLLSLSAALAFLVSGMGSDSFPTSGEAYAVVILLGGLAQFGIGLGLSTRLFYLRGKVDLREIENLKN
jgi:NADH:ubiquinone oxidoreductase subunit K